MKKFIAILLIFASAIIFSACDDEQEHRDNMEYLRKQEEKKQFEAKREEDKKIVEAQGEAQIAYYEDIEEDVPDGDVVEIFKIGSDLAVENGGQNALVEIFDDVYVSELWTYHYNGGNGAPAGTIKMINDDGSVYGPWQAEVYNSVYWVAKPGQVIPSGGYTIVDSDPGTWSQNGETGGQGMTWMMGIYK